MKNVVGISFRDEEPTSLTEIKTRDKHCRFIAQARNGKLFYIQHENINCPLARYYFGIDKNREDDLCKTLVSWNDAIDEQVALNYLGSAIRIDRPAKYIIYFPYPQKKIKPDIVIKIGTPDKIMSIVQKYSSLTGHRINASLSGIGAACGECTAYPLITGKENVSLGCYGSRSGVNLKEDELLLAFQGSSKMIELLSSVEI